MAHYLSQKDVRDARLSDTTRERTPQAVDPEWLKPGGTQCV